MKEKLSFPFFMKKGITERVIEKSMNNDSFAWLKIVCEYAEKIQHI